MNIQSLIITVLTFISYSPSILCQSLSYGSPSVHDTTFVNLKDYSNDFIYDMRYATSNNFLKSAVYECAECYLRLKTVESLVKVNNEAKKLGLKIKIFDCYRPLDIQKKMFAIVPNPNYVANPTTGSIHNRGGAVDLTLVDCDGKELDMGTDFDHFGKESAHNYKKLPRKILNNRKKLEQIMQRAGFTSLPSEWWHYNLVGSKSYSVSNFKWDCN